jgi:uncharacterized protein (DUF2235 family)
LQEVVTTSKNVIVCADGTGNEGGVEQESNVFTLYRLLTDQESEHAFYEMGLGTQRFPRIIRRAFGAGISKNIRDCYEFLVEHYEKGDSIFLFGFSRGAFTVRSLGGLISYCGLLKPKYRALINRAYALYKDAEENPKAARDFKRMFSIRPHIAFIGVWDTVGALGIPIRWMDRLKRCFVPPSGPRTLRTKSRPSSRSGSRACTRTWEAAIWKTTSPTSRWSG